MAVILFGLYWRTERITVCQIECTMICRRSFATTMFSDVFGICRGSGIRVVAILLVAAGGLLFSVAVVSHERFSELLWTALLLLVSLIFLLI